MISTNPAVRLPVCAPMHWQQLGQPTETHPEVPASLSCAELAHLRLPWTGPAHGATGRNFESGRVLDAAALLPRLVDAARAFEDWNHSRRARSMAPARLLHRLIDALLAVPHALAFRRDADHIDAGREIVSHALNTPGAPLSWLAREQIRLALESLVATLGARDGEGPWRAKTPEELRRQRLLTPWTREGTPPGSRDALARQLAVLTAADELSWDTDLATAALPDLPPPALIHALALPAGFRLHVATDVPDSESQRNSIAALTPSSTFITVRGSELPTWLHDSPVPMLGVVAQAPLDPHALQAALATLPRLELLRISPDARLPADWRPGPTWERLSPGHFVHRLPMLRAVLARWHIALDDEQLARLCRPPIAPLCRFLDAFARELHQAPGPQGPLHSQYAPLIRRLLTHAACEEGGLESLASNWPADGWHGLPAHLHALTAMQARALTPHVQDLEQATVAVLIEHLMDTSQPLISRTPPTDPRAGVLRQLANPNTWLCVLGAAQNPRLAPTVATDDPALVLARAIFAAQRASGYPGIDRTVLGPSGGAALFRNHVLDDAGFLASIGALASRILEEQRATNAQAPSDEARPGVAADEFAEASHEAIERVIRQALRDRLPGAPDD